MTLGYLTLAGIAGIIAFLWTLRRDVADLRERMARLEGLFEESRRREGTSS